VIRPIRVAALLGAIARIGQSLVERLVDALDALLDMGQVELQICGSPPARRRGDIGDRRQPVLEVVVEAVLRLARLQVEKAEHQRTGQAEQRGRKRRPHAGQRGREAGLELFEYGRRFRRRHVKRADRRPTDVTVSSSPQKVPSRPRKISSPIR
jgi:hypothetical protein